MENNNATTEQEKLTTKDKLIKHKKKIVIGLILAIILRGCKKLCVSEISS